MHVCAREMIRLLPARVYRRYSFFEALCREFGHPRLTLPEVDLDSELPGFREAVVEIARLPEHFWTSPLADQVALAKLAKITAPKRVLEVGGFRGETTLALALNTPTETRITSLDVDPDHGQVYNGHAAAEKIERWVGPLSSLPAREPFDLIFVDADHRYEHVRADTELALPRLAPGGWLVWHDYQDTAWLAGWNRVPEYLNELALELELRRIPATALAAFRG
jgi:hypothetical protein